MARSAAGPVRPADGEAGNGEADAIIYINHVQEGYDRDQVLGMSVDTVMPPQSREVFWAAFHSVGRTREMQEYEIEVSSSAGEAEWYRSRMVPFPEDGVLSGVLIIATNVSELRAAEAEVEQLRRLLPVCAWCKRLQSEEGAWLTMEQHLERERGSKVSHGMCPSCYREQMGGDHDSDDSNGNVA